MTEFNQVIIRKVENGYRADTIKQNPDEHNEYVFNNYSDLEKWLKDHFGEKQT